MLNLEAIGLFSRKLFKKQIVPIKKTPCIYYFIICVIVFTRSSYIYAVFMGQKASKREDSGFFNWGLPHYKALGFAASRVPNSPNSAQTLYFLNSSDQNPLKLKVNKNTFTGCRSPYHLSPSKKSSKKKNQNTLDGSKEVVAVAHIGGSLIFVQSLVQFIVLVYVRVVVYMIIIVFLIIIVYIVVIRISFTFRRVVRVLKVTIQRVIVWELQNKHSFFGECA